MSFPSYEHYQKVSFQFRNLSIQKELLKILYIVQVYSQYLQNYQGGTEINPKMRDRRKSERAAIMIMDTHNTEQGILSFI